MPTCAMVPLWLRVIYTLFVVVLVPVYGVHYGPENFLWFSDIALLSICFAMWLRSRLIVSMMAVGALALELLWTIDFIWSIVAQRTLLGMSLYMHDPAIPLYVRAMSLFHLFLPVIMTWLLQRWGYDSRALAAQTVLAWIVLPLTFAVSDASKNINAVRGLSGPQERIDPLVYLMLEMIALPLLVYVPTHFFLRWLFRPSASATPAFGQSRATDPRPE
jgi:hypothetical protein